MQLGVIEVVYNVFEQKPAKKAAAEATTPADEAEINTHDDDIIAKQVQNMRNQERIALEDRENKMYY